MPFKIVRNDIIKMHVDAIVNTANPRPLVGRGTDSAIYHAAGQKELLTERRKIGKIARGQAAITPAFGLHAKYVIHTVGPKWEGGNQGEESLLCSCYENSLRLAKENDCESIAFPLISTGVYGFPKNLALQIVISVVSKFLIKEDMMIYLVVFDKKATRLSEKIFQNIEASIDEEYVAIKHQEEYWGSFEAASVQEASFDDEAVNAEICREHHSESEVRERYGEKSRCFMEKEDFGMPAAPQAAMESAPENKLKKEKASVGRSLRDLMKQSDETFQQMLLRLIAEKGMTNAEAYKKANQDRKLFSKIKNDVNYQPKKKTAMAFALALELNLDETKDLLSRAGYTFSPSSNFDKAIQYFIETKEYNIYEIEIILYDLGLETLCNY